MSLFLIITLITFVYAYKTRLVSLLLKLCPQNNEIKIKTREIVTLEKELIAISMVNEFVKHVKLQRRINKLKEEKKELVKTNEFKIMKIRYSLTTAICAIVFGSLFTIIWLHRNEVVAEVPDKWLWPFSSFFDWSNYIPGLVTVPCWIAISSSASKAIAKHF